MQFFLFFKEKRKIWWKLLFIWKICHFYFYQTPEKFALKLNLQFQTLKHCKDFGRTKTCLLQYFLRCRVLKIFGVYVSLKKTLKYAILQSNCPLKYPVFSAKKLPIHKKGHLTRKSRGLKGAKKPYWTYSLDMSLKSKFRVPAHSLYCDNSLITEHLCNTKFKHSRTSQIGISTLYPHPILCAIIADTYSEHSHTSKMEKIDFGG